VFGDGQVHHRRVAARESGPRRLLALTLLLAVASFMILAWFANGRGRSTELAFGVAMTADGR
jgi:hypothetical protein